MGIQWASTLLGCVAAALIPIPAIFYLYGHKIRQRSSFAPTAPPQAPAQQNEASSDTQGTEKREEDAANGATNAAAQSSAPRKDQQSVGNGV